MVTRVIFSRITLQPKIGCPLKLSRAEPGQYLDGRPPWKTRLLLEKVLVRPVTIPLILWNSYDFAIVDTGSTFSPIQKSLWKKLSGHEDYQSSGDQTFLLANGQKQSSLGKVNWDCEVQGQKMNVTFYVMQDSDLTVPIILGIDFLLKSKMVLDFKRAQF